jgi:hypothetical protein
MRVILNKLSGFELKGASDFKLIDRRVLDRWLVMRERNAFLPGNDCLDGVQDHPNSL